MLKVLGMLNNYNFDFFIYIKYKYYVLLYHEVINISWHIGLFFYLKKVEAYTEILKYIDYLL